MKKLTLFFLFLFSSLTEIQSDEYPLSELKQFADGLNIEGGIIPRQYLRNDQIWANLCVILDRPFEDGVEWQELTNKNIYPLKEASLLSYNEAQVNYSYALIMYYYIVNAHALINNKDDTAKILIQVHRNTSGPAHLTLLEKLLLSCFPELHPKKIKENTSQYERFTYFFPDQNVEVSFCFGTQPDNLGKVGKYQEFHIVLSFSLVAGLHTKWPSGSLLLPAQHIPFSLMNVILEPKTKFVVENHLLQALEDIISTQKESVLFAINSAFLSVNPQKLNQVARFLTIQDFKEAKLLQVDGMFNPSQLPTSFCVVD